MNDGPIYREYSCTLSQKNSADLLKALAHTGGSITSCFSVGAPNVEEKHVGRCTMHFKLRFAFQHRLDAFHKKGFETTAPEKIAPLEPQSPRAYQKEKAHWQCPQHAKGKVEWVGSLAKCKEADCTRSHAIHRWNYCSHCQCDTVICGACGNNSCNGGHGELDGEDCPHCESAYDMQAKGQQRHELNFT